MKFAHSFSEELRNNEYPPEWQNAAIRYRQLKKCIKKVMQELDELGLSTDTLKRLAEHHRNTTSVAVDDDEVPEDRRYSFSSTETTESSSSSTSATSSPPTSPSLPPDSLGKESSTIKVTASKSDAYGGITLKYWFDGTLQAFSPKLVLTVDLQNGIPGNLDLSLTTRKALERLVKSQKLREAEDDDGSKETRYYSEELDNASLGRASAAAPQTTTTTATEAGTDTTEVSGNIVDDGAACGKDEPYKSTVNSPGEESCAQEGIRKEGQRKIQIPLSADTEFFHLLTSEIASLDVVQSKEEKDISAQVVTLGDWVTEVAKPTKFNSDSDLYAWREIFRIYVDCRIFFVARETDRSQRPVEKAEEKMRWFLGEVRRLKLSQQFKNKKSHALLSHFITLNMSILRLLRFQSINKTAMTKILKKFDKRTALGAREKYPEFIASNPFLSNHLAKAICFTMSERLLNIIPQLDDYLCPICSSISIKPVRLSCSHVFCVRCLVKLQRDRMKSCPICRSNVVLKASSDNLDVSLLNFLKHYFPKEAKVKQTENEREVTLEQFRGLQKRSRGGCVVS